jgi:aldose 1-epimerase
MQSELWGLLSDGSEVNCITLNSPNLRVVILTYGALLARLEVPDRTGRMDNVVLGLNDLAGYEGYSPYFGAIVGRYANRIARGRFALDGRAYQIPCNDGPNSLHGGPRGFSKQVWQVAACGPSSVKMVHVSPNGEEGYPGCAEVSVTYAIDADRGLRIAYEAVSDAPTVLNLSNHAYWNLKGEGSGSAMAHELQIEADYYTPVDRTAIPTGEIRPVEGTPFDFRQPVPVGRRVQALDPQLAIGKGYDHNWVLRGGVTPLPRSVARLHDPSSGRVLEVLTDQPGLQFYSGNFLDGTLSGPSGRPYQRGDAVVLETQHFPDSPNRPHFPTTTLCPGETFRSVTEFRFGTDTH